MAKHDIRAARAQRFTIQVREVGKPRPRKIAKIIFQDTDGSIFVAFPYFEQSEGLVAVVTLPPWQKHLESVSLEEGGKVTSHLVKYVHHRDGRCHFSQTGKVYTVVKKQSVPLNRYSGHLFTAQIQGLEGFQEASGPDYDPTNLKDQPITFNIRASDPKAVKILGYWYNKKRIRELVLSEVIGPGVTIRHGQDQRKGILLSAPVEMPGSGSFLVVTVFAIPPLTQDPGALLTFIGGFDSDEVINDLTRPTSFLALSYPADNLEALKAKIGSIDFSRNKISR